MGLDFLYVGELPFTLKFRRSDIPTGFMQVHLKVIIDTEGGNNRCFQSIRMSISHIEGKDPPQPKVSPQSARVHIDRHIQSYTDRGGGAASILIDE